MADSEFPGWHGTTIIGVRKGGEVVVAGDGQVSLGQTVIKGTARKVRRLSPGWVSRSWSAALRDRRRMPLPCWSGWKPSLRQRRASCSAQAVELAKDWRTDKYLQKLEAMLIVSDGAELYVITGAGDVLEPEHDVTAIGSGGNFRPGCRARLMESDMSAERCGPQGHGHRGRYLRLHQRQPDRGEDLQMTDLTPREIVSRA